MYLFKDSSISIHLVTNRGGLQLGEVASDGTDDMRGNNKQNEKIRIS